jgi:hypothetical protein
VKTAAERDRRRHPRFPQILEVQAREVPPHRSGLRSGPPVLGRVQNVSKGGICFLSQQPIARSALLRCEITVAEVPVGIPTLMQVRWTRKQNLQAESYLSGLQFLL